MKGTVFITEVLFELDLPPVGRVNKEYSPRLSFDLLQWLPRTLPRVKAPR